MTQAARREDRVALSQTLPGLGPITASAIVATIGTGKQFSTGS
ncbi:MAG: transposase [Litoreibacter sp.]